MQPSCQQVMSTVANHRYISTKVGVSASHYMHITRFSHQQAEGMEVELLQANRPSVWVTLLDILRTLGGISSCSCVDKSGRFSEVPIRECGNQKMYFKLSTVLWQERRRILHLSIKKFQHRESFDWSVVSQNLADIYSGDWVQWRVCSLRGDICN